MLDRHLHELRLDPRARLEVGGAGVGELSGFAASRIDDRQLRRHVAGRMPHQQLPAIRRGH
jgi:hypothetical protein